MAGGELQTTNLKFDDYHRAGDHAEFLWHFIEKYKLTDTCSPEVIRKGEEYLEKVRTLSDELRVMSIVSRERELSIIFLKILKAPDWFLNALGAFRYYLEKHIEIDSSEGGHADLLAKFIVDEQVETFYAIRLEMYECLAVLF